MNNNYIDKDTPVWQLTLGELIYSIKQSLPPQVFSSDKNSSENTINDEDYITGLKNLARFLKISYSQAWKMKKKGLFDDAIIQVNRTIFIHKKKAIEILAEQNSK